ncbi:HTH-type transcriptional regulator Hpr [Bacillus pumilus]|uniref:HTH-type transcriptional regulator Hpr n=1 Tax=Bacillus pumilus TaxID=1408 RepID=A0AAD0HLG4_BACPU|nr:HTH-type transcriptional regulator Hpr [Bacillus pumilus]AVM23194.1 HTH-type transcriptional regulator Hpr [Bacillus pumilus]TYS31550.1 HTH-type transcriptional regulator Hpr [Bacillus pumilus]TYS44560.1 HTH-type transcriptional regulator Hpr [Bacillus pumilus]TYS47188.1 HTH-type transcriptional regulator Hpr [Bacillus pumilus]
MNHSEQPFDVKEALLFSQRMAQLSKALWKSIEKDWQQWIKPYNLNINEHHILWIAYQLKGASISEIAKFGVMHVSTAFNFSKKLEERGFLKFSKKLNDKRNTYIELTPKGEETFHKLLEDFDPARTGIVKGAQPLHDIYGKFPEILEMMCIIRNVYGEDFMEIFEKSFSNIEKGFLNERGKVTKKPEELEDSAEAEKSAKANQIV